MNRNYALLLVLVLVLPAAVVAQGQGSRIPSFRGHEGLEMNHNLVVPQIAVGTGYTTSLVLLNLGDSQSMGWVSSQNLKTTGKVYFFRQDGTRLSVSVNRETPVSEFVFALDPSETASYELNYSGPDTSGWALIAIDDTRDDYDWGMMDDIGMDRGHRVMASVFYAYREAGQTFSRVGVVPSVYEMQRFFRSVLPAQSQADLSTGVAIVNTNATAVSVDLQLKDSRGQVVASKTLLLQPGKRSAPRCLSEDRWPLCLHRPS